MYSKNVRFDIAKSLTDRSVGIAAYTGKALSPTDIIRVRDWSDEIPGNGAQDFNWSKFQVKAVEAAIDEQLLYEESDTLQIEGDFVIFGAERIATQLGYPGGGGRIIGGDLYMRLSEFRFTTPNDGANRILEKVVLDRLRVLEWNYRMGFSPTLRYRIYISESPSVTVDDIPNDTSVLYPFSGSWSAGSISPQDITATIGDILVKNQANAVGEPFSMVIPTKEYTLSPNTEYVIHFVPLFTDGAMGMSVSIGCDTDITSQVTNAFSSAMVKTLEWGDSQPGISNPTSGYQSDTGPGIEIVSRLATSDYAHYVDLDDNDNPLPIYDDGGIDTFQLTVAPGAPEITLLYQDQRVRAVRTTAIEDIILDEEPVPYEFRLRFPLWLENKLSNPNDAVRLYSGSREIDQSLYRIAATRAGQVFSSTHAYTASVYLSEGLANSKDTIEAFYTRVLSDGTSQFNYKELINPKLICKQGRDYDLDFGESPARLYMKSGGSLMGLIENDYLWVKKSSRRAIKPLPVVGGATSSWLPRISLGTFIQRDVETAYGQKDVAYYIPEVADIKVWMDNSKFANTSTYTDSRPAASGDPYVCRASRDPVVMVDEFTIQLPRHPVYFWSGNWGSGLTNGAWVEDRAAFPDYTPPNIIDDPVVTGVITEPQWYHGINIYINDTLMDNSNITSWNHVNGLIRLSEPIEEGSQVTATYLYEVGEISIHEDLNPVQGRSNADRVGDGIRVVIRPEWSTYSSDTGDSETSRLAWHWISDHPSKEYSYDFVASTGSEGYSFDGSGPYPLAAETKALADYYIGEMSPNSVNFVDVRSVGGGIKEDDWFGGEKERLEIEDESYYYWGIGSLDGERYQADSTYVISVPSSIFSLYEDRFRADAAADVKIDPDDKLIVDAAISSGIVQSVLSSITPAARLAKMNEYASLAHNAREEVIDLIRDRIEKHVPAGTLFVLVDENKNIQDPNVISSSRTYSVQSIPTSSPPKETSHGEATDPKKPSKFKRA